MGRVLMVTWDGAGNAVPFQAIGQALTNRGHEITVLSHPSSRAAFEGYGCRFEGYQTAAAYDSRSRSKSGSEAEHRAWVMEHVWASEAIGRETTAAIDRVDPDVVVVDQVLPFAHAAIEASGRNGVVLCHTSAAGEPSRRGRDQLFHETIPKLNAFRTEVGVAPVESFGNAVDAVGVAIAATAPTFDPPAPNSSILQVGPIRPTVDGPSPELDVGDGPLIVVSLSTGWMHQIEVLQWVLDATASLPAHVVMTIGPSVDASELTPSPNATLVPTIPHDAVLPRASVLVTHAGLGTVSAGLIHGVPMVCVPLGRDQPVNAARAAELGAARVIRPAASTGELAEAIEAVVGDTTMRSTCSGLSARIRSEVRLDLAIDAIESRM